MKFVCDRCQTRYSIADEKVRRKILRIRCKSCGNVIVVQDEHLGGQGAADGRPPEPGRPSSSGNLKAASSSGPKPPPLPRVAKGADPLGGNVEWYLAIDGEQKGPFSRSEVAKRIRAVGPGKSVHVWKEGMSAWKPPQEVSVVAHELSLLRPAPPNPARATGAASAALAKADSDAPTTPLPLAGTVHPRAHAEDASTDVRATDPAGFSDITTKKGKELRELAALSPGDDFGEVTTKRTKDLREVLSAPPSSSYTEATTKKNKNLQELEADAPTAPGMDVGEPDRTPLPMKPLPPVGGKVASQVPPSRVSMPDPVVSFETPAPVAPAAALRPSASFGVARTPPPVSGPGVRPSASFGIPGTPLPVTVPGGRPSASFGIPGTPLPAPVPAFKLPAGQSGPVAPLGSAPSRPSTSFAVPSASMAVAPSAPFAVAGGPLPTPQPVSVAPFGDPLDPAALPEAKPGQGKLAALLERQPGLKYVFAAVAIVGLIILLGLVILRGGGRTANSEPTIPAEPAPPPTEPTAVAVAEPAPPPAPVPEEKPAPAAPAPGKPSASAARSPRHAAGKSAPERAAKEPPLTSPPRLAGARPNPFDESRSVSQAQITAVVRNPANQAGLKSCYERALKMDNHLTSGRIDVTVSIAASGAVQRVVVNAPSSFILVEPCIKSAVKRWSFPPNTEDYATSFPLIMQGGM